jgi:hypothetical protein
VKKALGGPRRWGRLALLAAVAAALLWLALHGEEPVPAAVVATGPPKGPQFFGQVGSQVDAQVDGAARAPAPGERARRRQQLVDNYALADHSYCSYRAGSMYPAHSRPMSQNPDQAWPNAPVTEVNPMRGDDRRGDDRRGDDRRSDPNVLVHTSQSRVFLAAGESAAFSLRAVEPNGNLVPLVITRAVAAGIVPTTGRPTTQVSLAFADDGTGAFAGVLSPAQTGLSGFHGTIRTEVRFAANGKNGVVIFDVIHSPKLPAVWVGAPRETLEDGSLTFILRAEMRQPGRYVVTGRVDDAKGRPFALATFNEVLGPGPNDVRLVVFGKLMIDGAPALPLTLRDVDGYLLKENTDPDRELMPRLEGPLLTSRTHSMKGVSEAEWNSEERERYLKEFAKDRKGAAAELARFDPSQPLPPSACGPVK